MRWWSRVTLASLLACLSHVTVADQTDSRLPDLFDALASAPNAATAQTYESQIWHLWIVVDEPKAKAALDRGIGFMNLGDFRSAITHFDAVVEHAPDFAEGWNKRATAYYLAGDHARSMQDIERTLRLEPRHFGAISGMGLIFMAREDFKAALDAFELVLKIHPFAAGANLHQEQLRRRLAGQSS